MPNDTQMLAVGLENTAADLRIHYWAKVYLLIDDQVLFRVYITPIGS